MSELDKAIEILKALKIESKPIINKFNKDTVMYTSILNTRINKLTNRQINAIDTVVSTIEQLRDKLNKDYSELTLICGKQIESRLHNTQTMAISSYISQMKEIIGG